MCMHLFLFQVSKIPPIYGRLTTSNISVEEGGVPNVSKMSEMDSSPSRSSKAGRRKGIDFEKNGISGVKIMHSSTASVICYSWREIAATGRRYGYLDEDGHRASLKPDNGVRAFEGALGIPAHKGESERRGHLLRLGGGLSGSEQLVHGHVPGSFSYR